MELNVGVDLGYKNLSICIIESYRLTQTLSEPYKPDAVRIFSPQLLEDLKGQMDIKTIFSILQEASKEAPIRKVMMEDVHSFPKQGMVSTFKFGYAKGLLTGICSSLGYDIVWVDPRKWKAYYGLIGKDKKASLELAKGWTDYPKLKTNHNEAEAFLIARYLQSGKYLF